MMICEIDVLDLDPLFCSPKPKDQGELLWSLTVRRRRRFVRPSIHNL